MKIKALVAAVALAAASNGAHAAIGHSLYQGPQAELFMTVWSPSLQQSYGLDLGVTVSDMYYTNNSFSVDFSGDANFSTLVGATDLVFTVTGGDQSFMDYATYGIMTTTQNVSQLSTAVGEFVAAANVASTYDTMAGYLNAAGGDSANPALNNSSFCDVGSACYFDQARWGTTTASNHPAAGDLDTATSFIFMQLDQTNFTYMNPIELGSFTLSNSGLLSYASVSAVPVPAAVWLFGSGLLGLVSVARRRAK